MVSVQILDGGLGTSLQDQYSVKFDTSTPLWASHLLVSDPATLQACQRDFGQAGVDVLLTATYQVSIEGFALTKTTEFPSGIPRDAIGRFLQTAVDVAEEAKVRDCTKIALSLGPYGACMIPGQEYSGDYDSEHDDEEALYRWHLERLRVFTEAEGDLIGRMGYVAFETLPRLDEIRAVRRAIRAAGIRTPFWISCVFPGENDSLPDGSSVEQIIQAAVSPMEDGNPPWGVGINCTKIHNLPSLVSKFGECVAKSVTADQISAAPTLVLYPMAPMERSIIQQRRNGRSLKIIAMKALEILYEYPRPWELHLAQIVNDASTSGYFDSFLVGGCCKASHDDIGKLRKQLKTA